MDPSQLSLPFDYSSIVAYSLFLYLTYIILFTGIADSVAIAWNELYAAKYLKGKAQ